MARVGLVLGAGGVTGGGRAGFFPEGWPRRPLWVCALRLDDARLAVLGHGHLRRRLEVIARR